jgi:hypothetical protein
MKKRIKLITLAMLAACVANAQDIEGDWHGTLKAGLQELRLALHISKDNGGRCTPPWKASTKVSCRFNHAESGHPGIPFGGRPW